MNPYWVERPADYAMEECGVTIGPTFKKAVTGESKASERQVGGSHYKDMVIQPSEFSHKNGLGWCEGSVVKYVCRHNLKGGLQDLLKAKHYLDLLIEWEYEDEQT